MKAVYEDLQVQVPSADYKIKREQYFTQNSDKLDSSESVT
eukprot:CAMPEP_0116943122 /NCGR_PEP_ID=MMETSP0467-20121206/35005_1 /TAXON_ID=283647 /ORGANISM="Mesodinium pulex, Strain SPMC105" /LENGTH=39 /DNA_ID= /DNA_START= /DNA_END= /DNA_ORIENTATION=